MIDVVGAIVLIVLSVVGSVWTILSAGLERARAKRLLTIVLAWFAAVVVLAGAGVFVRVGPPAIALAIFGPIIVGIASALRGSSLRAVALGVPLALLVALHVGRLLGGFFLVLHEQGRLPVTFARTAGWGDIAVAAIAPLVAWAIAREIPGWRAVTLLWNVVAFVDLATAVTLGLGSTPGFPLRFIYEDAVPNTITALPWMLIPGFLVPFYFLTHFAIFARVFARERAARPAAVAAR